MKKRLVGLITIASLLTVLVGMWCYSAWHYRKSRTGQLFDEIVPRVETSDLVVALTFGDGPKRDAVKKLLPILRAKGVKATFFLIGTELEKSPDLG